MEKSKRNRFAVYTLILLLMLLSGSLGYYSYTLKSEKHSLHAKLNEYDDKLFRRDKELINLMDKLDSTQDNIPTSKSSNIKRDNTVNQQIVVEEIIDNSNVEEDAKIEEILALEEPITNDSKKDNELEILNTVKDSVLIKESYSITEVIEVPKPRKPLLFKGKEISKGESVNLAVQFAPNSHVLMNNSELIALVNFMQEHPNIIIKLSGHTQPNPPKGSAVYEETAKMHLGLSKKRVESVSKYLIEQGVSSEQIMTAYFGGSKPKYTRPSLNRRVEMEIIRGLE